jgi:hypothetical protein
MFERKKKNQYKSISAEFGSGVLEKSEQEPDSGIIARIRNFFLHRYFSSRNLLVSRKVNIQYDMHFNVFTTLASVP